MRHNADSQALQKQNFIPIGNDFNEKSFAKCDILKEEAEEELQGVTRKKPTATDLLVLTRLFGT